MESSSKSCFFNFFVIFSVPFLLLAAIVLGYLHYIPLKIELHTLIVMSIIFIIFLFFIKHNADFASCKFKSSHYQMEKKLQDYIDDYSLTIMNQTKSTASIDQFFGEFYKTLRNDNFSNVAAGIFPTLGILGTFIAIAISMPDFSVKSTEALDQEITTLLGGVGTAFYASIYGIFLSLWWIFFEKNGLSKIFYEVENIKALYSKYIWSDSELKRVEYLASEEQNNKFIDAISQTLSLDFVKNFSAVNEKKLELAEKIGASQERMNEKIEKVYISMMDLFEKAAYTQSQTMQNLDKTNNALNIYTNSLEKNSTSIEKLLENLNQSVKTFSTLTQYSKESLKIQKVNEQGMKNFINSAESFETVANDMKNVSINMQKSLKQVSDGRNSIEAIENIDKTAKEFTKAANSLQFALNEFDQKFSKNVQNSFEIIDSEVADIVKKLADSSSYITKQGVSLQNSLQQYHETLLKKMR